VFGEFGHRDILSKSTEIFLHSFNIKFIARQSTAINKFKHFETQIINCNTNVLFNRQCLAKQLTPSYVKYIKVPRTSPAAIQTEQRTRIHRIKDEIKYLYRMKQHLNMELYQTHLLAAREWNDVWHLICIHMHAVISKHTTLK
jgi:hypothetical protein